MCLKRSLLTAIRAVSDPEKKAEKDRSSNKSKIIRTIPAVLIAHLFKGIVRFLVVFLIVYYPYWILCSRLKIATLRAGRAVRLLVAVSCLVCPATAFDSKPISIHTLTMV